ncbi:MAG: SH3 domain-containing protein [Aggregatilineales bacterium]
MNPLIHFSSIRTTLFTALLASLLVAPGNVQAFQGSAGQGSDQLTLQVDQGTIPVRDTPLLNGKVYRTLSPGERMEWNGTSKTADGRTWIPITLSGVPQPGWISPDNDTLFQVDPNQVTLGITVGAVGETAQTLTLYTSAALNAQATKNGQIVTLPVKTSFTVTDGPTLAEDYTWWQIKTASGQQGWIPDTPGYLQITKPLIVYGYQVCDGYDLKKWGVTGWDSIVKELPNLIAKGEKVQCLASVNFKGDGTPVVAVLAHAESANDKHDTLYLFTQDQGGWLTWYQQTALPFARTERLGFYDVTGDKLPTLVWAIRADGTGEYLTIKALHYAPAVGAQPIMDISYMYKGNFQIGASSIRLTQAILKDGEGNCCPTGFNRIFYAWQNNQFVKTIDDQPPPPYFLQGPPKSS